MTCPGLFYRVVDQRYITPRGVIVFTREYRLRKLLSCPGCAECSGLPEAWTDALGVQSGDLVRLFRRGVKGGKGWPTVEIIKDGKLERKAEGYKS